MKSPIDTILQTLPQRYPFLLIDRVLDYQPGYSATVLKNVSINEPFFQGHFPQVPLFPGVLILEMMSQASAFLSFPSDQVGKDRIYLLAGFNKVRFKAPVHPGDQLVATVKCDRRINNMLIASAVAMVDDKVTCTADFLMVKGVDSNDPSVSADQ